MSCNVTDVTWPDMTWHDVMWCMYVCVWMCLFMIYDTHVFHFKEKTIGYLHAPACTSITFHHHEIVHPPWKCWTLRWNDILTGVISLVKSFDPSRILSPKSLPCRFVVVGHQHMPCTLAQVTALWLSHNKMLVGFSAPGPSWNPKWHRQSLRSNWHNESKNS